MADHTREILESREQPVWGARDIGQIIGKKTVEAANLLRLGMLPAKKLGGTWVAFPSALLRACGADLEAPGVPVKKRPGTKPAANKLSQAEQTTA